MEILRKLCRFAIKGMQIKGEMCRGRYYVYRDVCLSAKSMRLKCQANSLSLERFHFSTTCVRVE